MSQDPTDFDAHGADLLGLPQRSPSSGRDQVEEIASLYLDRVRGGEQIDIGRFAADYPGLEEELMDFLPLVSALEGWKSHQELRSVQQPIPDNFYLTRLGDCRIVREIARGGMGVVFEAEQGAIGRRVAVKLLPWRFPKKSRWAEQFVREAQTVANLQHAHIVPVFSFGEQDDRYYYVMQLVEGVGLDSLIARWRRDAGIVSLEDLISEAHPHIRGAANNQRQSKRLLRHDSWQQLGKIAAQIVSAIRHAHKHGILHRDIKPGNLLIDVQGKVWITDFGLAIGHEQTLGTSTEPLAGTMRYMAPEQFYGTVDERSDIYAFGATLYELCTLQPAFQADDRQRLIDHIQAGRIKPPRAINPAIPIELEAIILKAMAPSAEKRHQSIDRLHADLLNFLNPDASRSQRSWWGKLRRWF